MALKTNASAAWCLVCVLVDCCALVLNCLKCCGRRFKPSGFTGRCICFALCSLSKAASGVVAEGSQSKTPSFSDEPET